MRHIQARVSDEQYKRFHNAATNLGLTLEALLAKATEEFILRKEEEHEVNTSRKKSFRSLHLKNHGLVK